MPKLRREHRKCRPNKTAVRHKKPHTAEQVRFKDSSAISTIKTDSAHHHPTSRGTQFRQSVVGGSRRAAYLCDYIPCGLEPVCAALPPLWSSAAPTPTRYSSANIGCYIIVSAAPHGSTARIGNTPHRRHIATAPQRNVLSQRHATTPAQAGRRESPPYHSAQRIMPRSAQRVTPGIEVKRSIQRPRVLGPGKSAGDE